MSIILTKSPFIVNVSATGLIGAKVEIFMWSSSETEPAFPQYTLSKLSPASNVTSVNFDVAPYLNERITSNVYTINSSSVGINTNRTLYTNVRIIKYKLVGTTYTSVTDTLYTAFKGYLEQKDGINLDYGNYLLDEKTYYYHYDSNKTYDTLKAGDITVLNIIPDVGVGLNYIYTNLRTGATVTNTITTGSDWQNIYRVYPSYWADGNKLEIFDIDLNLNVAVYFFKPITECRYSPVTLDFINKYGAWQREFLFKNSTDFINTENKSYKNYRINPSSFNAQESLVATFNSNGNETIKCNTGFVDEDFKGTIKQLLLSHRILINNRAATITTNQIELQKNINNKLINYALDFTFSNPII